MSFVPARLHQPEGKLSLWSHLGEAHPPRPHPSSQAERLLKAFEEDSKKRPRTRNPDHSLSGLMFDELKPTGVSGRPHGEQNEFPLSGSPATFDVSS